MSEADTEFEKEATPAAPSPEEVRKAVMSLMDDNSDAADMLNQLEMKVQTPAIPSLPSNSYLDATVVPLLLQALDALSTARISDDANKRPVDPIEFIAMYLFANNPQNTNKVPT
eukprot:TRINITY_DN21146_c0_g1_i1.p1 TRINITY_DN21146_c0_g1~~TRINITY_DN21146_c0_g1_i1.p1  ORF type:complete len:114 (+),score=27.48 TRINITY_DN21146_c0_g1_i1:110-451(+)